MNRGAVLLSALFAGAAAACAQSPGHWDTTKAQGAAAVESGDCARAWTLIWPWARRGQIEARAILAGGVAAAGLTPPGGSGDSISQFRHAVILSVHGAAEGDTTATEVLRSLVRTEPVSQMGGHALVQCLDSGNPPRSCVANAVAAGFVPDFESYARQIDDGSRFRPARCAVSGGSENTLPKQ